MAASQLMLSRADLAGEAVRAAAIYFTDLARNSASPYLCFVAAKSSYLNPLLSIYGRKNFLSICNSDQKSICY